MSYSNYNLLNDYLDENVETNRTLSISLAAVTKEPEVQPKQKPKSKGLPLECPRCKHKWNYIARSTTKEKGFTQCSQCTKNVRVW